MVTHDEALATRCARILRLADRRIVSDTLQSLATGNPQSVAAGQPR
jgi:ABC-type lipoprotein export system ATPase subunit